MSARRLSLSLSTTVRMVFRRRSGRIRRRPCFQPRPAGARRRWMTCRHARRASAIRRGTSAARPRSCSGRRRILILPLAGLELAAQKDPGSLLAVLLGDLSEVLVENRDAMPLGSLFAFTRGFVAPGLRGRDAEINNLIAGGEFWLSGSLPRAPISVTSFKLAPTWCFSLLKTASQLELAESEIGVGERVLDLRDLVG